MPLCTLHLVRLERGNGETSKEKLYTKRAHFLRSFLRSSLGSRVITACVVRRPVIRANRIDPVYLNSTGWDLLLVIGPDKDAPTPQTSSSSKSTQQDPPTPLYLKEHPQTKADIDEELVLDVGIPTSIIASYSEKTKKLKEDASKADKIPIESLLANPARAHPGYQPKTSQLLEMSEDLVDLSNELHDLGTKDGLVDANGPVQQLNFLSFKKTKEDKERYYKYGKAFPSVAAKFGGQPKLLGGVVTVETREEEEKRVTNKLQWDEVALVNYSSIDHFAAMAASEDYQSINRDYRLPSLDDTTIICTQEVDLDGLPKQGQARM